MRVAVLSDIHSNLVALDAVLAHAGTVDAIWHLGDVVGYGPDPDGVVARLIEVGAVGVRGNHDAAALGGREIEWFNPEARAAAEWTRDKIDGTTRAWLSALPERHTIGRMTLVHGSPRDPIREYVSSADVALENLAVLETDFGLHGHTHVPVAFCLLPDERLQVVGPGPGPSSDGILSLDGQRALINPGSVGQPRDGDPDASYLILDPEAATLTWHRVAYDVAAVQAAIRAAGLPGRLADRLAYGA